MRVPVSIATLVCALAIVALPSQAASQPLVAVLDFQATDLELSVGELGLLTEGARKVAVERLGSTYGIITRENLEDLLRAHGKTLEKCQGACETETGRMLGAELVVTGHATRAFGEIHLTMKIHRTDPPTLLAAELGKTSGTNKLPALTQAVSGALLARVNSGRETGSAATRTSSTPAAAPVSPIRSNRQTPTPRPETSPSSKSETYEDSVLPADYPRGYPQPSVDWIAFKGALRDASLDRRRESDLRQKQEKLSRALNRRDGVPRDALLKSRAEHSFDLSLLEASKRASDCWAHHVSSGEPPLACGKSKPIAPRAVLQDIKEYQKLTGIRAHQLPDELLFIRAFMTLLSTTSPENKREALGWLEDHLVPKDHIQALLFVGKHKLYQGDLYTAARLLTRAVDRTQAVDVDGAFARYLLAWTYMLDVNLGEGHLSTFPRHKGSAEKRWGGGAGVTSNLLGDLSDQLIQWKNWDRVDKTAPALLSLIRDDQSLSEESDYTDWVGPLPEGMSPDEVN